MDKGEIVLYKNTDGNIRLDVQLLDDSVWINRNQMSDLFNRDVKTIGKHINNIFKEGELSENAVVANFATTASDKKIYQVAHYNLDVIISVGYRVKSKQGTQFRIWATQRLKEHIIKGFTLNDDRFKTGQSMNFFNELQDRIRQIRLSEKFFYQKIKDIYITSIDYDSKDAKTIQFFKIVQNKLLWAISQHTPMYMKDWIERLDVILKLNGRELLTHAGKISHQMALDKSSTQYDKYREVIKTKQIEQSLKEIEADIKDMKR